LHPAKAIPVTTAATPAGDHASGVWVVQPNFDVMVYLDRTTPPQLAFLERHAERTQSQQYMAHYRLTRASVYQGLESGTILEAFLEELGRHAQTPLPQNVTVEIREWAAFREQVILHHRADVLEFADTAARDAMLTANINGRAVGDRFLLLASTVTQRNRLPKSVGTVERLNYAQPLPKILRADETGGLQMNDPAASCGVSKRWLRPENQRFSDLRIPFGTKQASGNQTRSDSICAASGHRNGPSHTAIVAAEEWLGQADAASGPKGNVTPAAADSYPRLGHRPRRG
jgi:hypothetical protein